MFIGEYSHSIDQKGRVAVPSKFRRKLTRGAVVTRGIDNCLFIYTKEEWDKLAEKIKDLPLSQKDTRAFARLMFAGAMDVQVDGQGRIMIPDYLRKFSGLTKKIIVAGLFNRLEIWDKAKWETYKNQTEKQSKNISERLKELGI